MATRSKTKKSVSGKARKKAAAKKVGKSQATALVAKFLPERPLLFRDLGAKAEAPRATGAKRANTIVYVHGIGKKPTPSVLKCQWDMALAGTQLGDRTRMAYWANPADTLKQTCADGDLITSQIEEGLSLASRGLGDADPAEMIEREVASLTRSPAQREFLLRIAGRMNAANAIPRRQLSAQDMREKILPIGDPLRRWITSGLTKALLRDVHDFFFVEERRKAMEDSLMNRLAGGGGPFVVIGHSQGSMIAYDVLRRLDKAQFQVALFITIGSPLGIDEVQAVFRQWTGQSGTLPFPSCVEKWVNVAERIDPVALDPDLSGEFDGPIENHVGFLINPDSPRHPHSATGYLRTEFVRDPVRETVGSASLQSISPFALAKDLVSVLEDGHSAERHEVLIQLAVGDKGPANIDEIANDVEARIRSMVREGQSGADPEVERLRHFVVARLTRQELETLRCHWADLRIQGIWRNASKRALISESTNTVQARPANLGYGADGNKICWAVLDTGIRADHPHFRTYANVLEQWDCIHPGVPKQLKRDTNGFGTLDGNGHGTHVAGIIAGSSKAISDREPLSFEGMAPRCSLIGMKVLDDRGNGKDSWIIKALDLVASMNEKAGKLVVHGLNLSLGGSFDPSAFGCGHTPLCQEIRRLWQQGVLVCLAAGNEGYAVLAGAEGEIPTNMDLSIGDPANLEEAIAVGSVHKTNPHTYGISYFSSRGPTADGRRKPDVVAPGEKILSARHDWKGPGNSEQYNVEDLFVAMSGTSMATPHVSGVLAAFLSLRREFIGYPDRVKAILMEGCIDLRRDQFMQGAGLPNLIKMLAFN